MTRTPSARCARRRTPCRRRGRTRQAPPSAASSSGTSRWPRKKIASTLRKLGPPLAGSPVVLCGCLRDDVRVGADEGVVDARLVAETLDHRERVRHRVVLRDAVARVGPGEHDLARSRTARPPRPCWRPVRTPASAAAAALPATIRCDAPSRRESCLTRCSTDYGSRNATTSSEVGLRRNPPPPTVIDDVLLAVLAHVGGRNRVRRHVELRRSTAPCRCAHRRRGS